jgi:TPR repeat protein
MMRLYRSYASGIGVSASPDMALTWLQKAADVGDPRAAKELAAAYTVGFGTQADPERAAFWRARAEVN